MFLKQENNVYIRLYSSYIGVHIDIKTRIKNKVAVWFLFAIPFARQVSEGLVTPIIRPINYCFRLQLRLIRFLLMYIYFSKVKKMHFIFVSCNVLCLFVLQYNSLYLSTYNLTR